MKYTVWVDTDVARTTIMNEDDEMVKVIYALFAKTELNNMMREIFHGDVDYEVYVD